MNYAERLEKVAVVGAAGKMGSGIVLLLALEMADLSLKAENSSRRFVLQAIDVSQSALSGLMAYLRVQVRKEAEKKVVRLRKAYAGWTDLVENSEIIDQYVQDVLDIVRPVTSLEAAADSTLIFEAVSENLDLKVKLLLGIKQNNRLSPWFFTNTSSIPIEELNKLGALDGCILGFHFYNPPAVQKLVELIPARSTRPELVDFSQTLAKNLRKKVIFSNDTAGFIGNGHFMRDILHGLAEASDLTREMALEEAIYMVDRVSRDFLLRPMGIFQLADYVGLDVCQCIMRVMTTYLSVSNLNSPLLDRLVAQGVFGGQYPDGSQKNGFLQYEKNRPVGVFVPDRNAYRPLSEFQSACDERLGPTPDETVTWKSVVKHLAAAEKLSGYFSQLASMKTLGAGLASRYGRRSREIALKLVADGVARSEADVNTVLLIGFFHAYGPINSYFTEEESR